jgi:hypothetical protein
VPLRQRRPGLPAAFVQVVERALAHDPAHRYRSAAEMERALSGLVGGAPMPAPPSRRRGVAALAYAAGVTSVLLLVTLWGAGQRALRPKFRVASTRPYVTWTLSRFSASKDPTSGYAWRIQALGDLDADSLPEFGIAAPRENGRGEVHILTGREGGLLPKAMLHGEGDDWFGPLAAGDANGDGWPDLAVAAPYHDGNGTDAGRGYLYWGGPGFDEVPDRVFDGPAHCQVGWNLSLAGDLNGDGAADLVVGSPFDRRRQAQTGRAYVYLGGPSMDTVADLEVSPEISGSEFGVVESGVDLNGDGRADLAVGARFDESDGPATGRAYVYLGGDSLDGAPDLVLRAPKGARSFGCQLLAPGDLDRDGFADLVVGAEFADGFASRSGAAYVYRGGPHPSDRPWLTLRGGSARSVFGGRGMAAGDLNGDGAQDLVIAAAWHSVPQTSAGAIFCYFGGPRMDGVCDVSITGTGVSEEFGSSLACLGDAGGDGCADLLVGSTNYAQAAGGLVSRVDFARHRILRPRSGDVLAAGTTTTLMWSGAEPAEVSLSTDGGSTWRRVLAGVGGANENHVDLRLPETPASHARFRLRPARHGVRGAPVEVDVRLVDGSSTPPPPR